jgi:hypothetical protein
MTAMGISPFLKNKDYQIRALGVKKNLCCGAAHYAAASSAAAAPSPSKNLRPVISIGRILI